MVYSLSRYITKEIDNGSSQTSASELKCGLLIQNSNYKLKKKWGTKVSCLSFWESLFENTAAKMYKFNREKVACL